MESTTKELWEFRLEVIKTTAIVFGIVFGLIGLYREDRAAKLQRMQATKEMVAKFSEEFMVKAADKLFRHATNLSLGSADAAQVLSDLAPLRQHLVTWAMCISAEICENDRTMIAFCRKLVSYEYAAKGIFTRIDVEYNQKYRSDQYYNLLEICQDLVPLPSQ